MKKLIILSLTTLLLTGCYASNKDVPSNNKTKETHTVTQQPTVPVKIQSNHKKVDYDSITPTQLYAEGEKCEKENNSIQAIEYYYKASDKGDVNAKKKLSQFKLNSKDYKELKIK